MSDDLRAAILESARRLQIDPRDLGTLISYETAGAFGISRKTVWQRANKLSEKIAGQLNAG